MSYLSQLFEPRSLERPSTPLSQQALAEILGGQAVYSGSVVNASTALQTVAVYACVRLISETFATLPALVYRRLARGKERATEHPLYSVLHDIANPEQTSVEYRETCQAHVLLFGHSYSEITRNSAGEVKALWPITPSRVTMERNARNELVYVVALPEGGNQRISSNRMLHISAMLGLSPIAQARQAIGLAMATEEYGARFFSNSAKPSGVLEHPGHLSDDASRRLREQYQTNYGGLSNAHKIAILEEGMKWTQIGIPPEDAQFLETRKYQTTEIARLFRVPPHMIADLEHATFSNIEHQSIDFVTHTMRPWLVRWEQGENKALLTETERRTYFIEYLVDGLLRGDIQSRYSAYATARQNGWLNGNEIREFENMNPYDGGDEYLVNGNMIPVSEATADRGQPTEEEEPTPDPSLKGGEEEAEGDEEDDNEAE